MIGAEHVDEIGKAAVKLVLVIGDIGSEIGVAAVGLDQRPVDVVAIGGGAKQRLFAILIVFDRRSVGRRQAAFVDVALGAKILDGRSDLIGRTANQRTLRKEYVMLDVE